MTLTILLSIIVISVAGLVWSIYETNKHMKQCNKEIIEYIGLKTNITYKLTDKEKNRVLFIRILGVSDDRIYSYICNTLNGNIGLYKNTKEYLHHIISKCEVEEMSEWEPKEEPKNY